MANAVEGAPAAALVAATRNAACAVGRGGRIGSLNVGKQADLSFYRLDELRFSGAGDPLAALVLCGAHSADRVMIGGEWRVENALPVNVDVAKLRHEHGNAAKAFLEAL